METPKKYEPRGDRVLVKRLPRPQPKPGELIEPDSQKKPFDEGEVVAVGPGTRNRTTGHVEPIGIAVGEHVCFLEYAGTEVVVDGVTYLSMRDEEIHGRRT